MIRAKRGGAIDRRHDQLLHGATIDAILPGNTHAEGLQDLGPDHLDAMAASIAPKRPGAVESIGHAAPFPASGEAGYITGRTIVVDAAPGLFGALEALAET